MARLQYVMDDSLVTNAENILNAQGIPPKVAIQLFYRAVITQRGLPFRPAKVPNTLTRETLQKSKKGVDVEACANAEDMFRKLKGL